MNSKTQTHDEARSYYCTWALNDCMRVCAERALSEDSIIPPPAYSDQAWADKLATGTDKHKQAQGDALLWTGLRRVQRTSSCQSPNADASHCYETQNPSSFIRNSTAAVHTNGSYSVVAGPCGRVKQNSRPRFLQHTEGVAMKISHASCAPSTDLLTLFSRP